MNNKTTLTKEDILNFITEMSYSQGFYGRLLRQIKEDKKILTVLEKQKFTDTLDIVFFLER